MANYDDEFNNEYDDETPLTDYDDDSYANGENDGVQGRNVRNKERSELVDKFTEPRRRVASKPDHRPLLLAIGVAAIIVIAATFTIVNNELNPKLQLKKPTTEIVTETEEETEATAKISDASDIEAKLTVDGVIQKVDPYENSIMFVSLDDNKSYSVKIKGSTFLKDRYNNEIMLTDFSRGETVTFVYDKSDRLAYVMKSSGSFETSDVSVSIDQNRKIITDKTNNMIYYYDDKLVSCYKDSNVDLSTVTAEDKVVLKGYKDTVYYINVTLGHGSIELANKDKIKNGTIDIDTAIVAKPLSEASTITVTEGPHNVVVKGDNCEVYIKDIEVSANQAYSLDLSEVQIKQGVLLIKANVSDYLLYVNNTLEISREPLILDYGAYTVRIEKEGYKTFEQQIVIDRDQYNIEAELEENIPKGKLTVNTTPEYADVYVDNTKVGISPLTVQIAQGMHNLTVKKEGYKDVAFNGIQITNIESQYNITLQSDVPADIPSVSAGTSTAAPSPAPTDIPVIE